MNQDVVGGFMNTLVDSMGNKTIIDYATEVGACYVWSCMQEDDFRIDREAYCFITDGQIQKGDYNHNAILMKNPEGLVFLNNICPYAECFMHGFEALDKKECKEQGIKYIILLDEDMMEKQNKMIEKMGHYKLNHLLLSHQKLHHHPGCGTPLDENAPPHHGVVGVTFLPPNFFWDNPDIIIIASTN